MKVCWVSPTGTHLAVAQRIQAAGHMVVVYGHGNGHGDGLPHVPQPMLAQACQVADLTVVDSVFPVVRTRRSWRPATDSLFFDELRRHHSVTALGPTPTIDLLVGDARYLRKMCQRFGIPYDRGATGAPWSSGAWFMSVHIVPPGPYLDPWLPLFKSVGFRGWFELRGVMTPDGPVVQGASAEWDEDSVPEGKEYEWLELMQK